MKKERKERTDKGRFRIKERDVIMLRWMTEQYCIRLDHVQILGGRLSLSNLDNKPLAESTANHLIRRWVQAGWVNSRKFIVGRPMWIWPTKDGLSFTHVKFPYYEPTVSRLEHIHATNSVRLWIEDQLRQGNHLPYEPIDWLSERKINREQRIRKKKHIADDELGFGGSRVGIEVELNLKSKARYDAIFKELKRKYQDIWYFAVPKVLPDLQRIIHAADPYQETFTIYRLDEAYNVVSKVE